MRDSAIPEPGTTTSSVEASSQVRRQEERAVWPPRLGDIASVVLLLVATVHLVAHNGGRAAGDMVWVLAVAAGGVVFLVPSLCRESRGLSLFLVAGCIAPLIALAFAEIRAGAVRPLAAAALASAVVVATLHLWRRPWGPVALGSILALTAARSWYLTFLAWWGSAQGRPTWMALSWHNQSGTLMGALGVAAAAAVAVLYSRPTINPNSRRNAPGRGAVGVVVLAAIVLAGATLAGAWLSGSRGAVIATGMGLFALIVALVRGGEIRRAAPALIGVALAAIVTLAGLEAMVQSDAGQPLTTRDQSAVGNLSERMGYWQAAVGMAGSRPLTGWGPGSYRWASLPHYPGDTGLTASAHNEYLEAVGETGLIGAAPVWFAAITLAILAALVMVRKPRSAVPSARRAGAVAAVAGVAVLGLHAGLDFDWDYPVLMALLAMGGAVLWVEHAPPSRQTPWALAIAAGGSMLLLLGVSIAGTAMETAGRAPWELRPALAGALTAVDAGDVQAARSYIATAETWNPGAPPVPIARAMVEHHAGTIGDSALAAIVDPTTTIHADQILIARQLLEAGNARATREIVDSLALVLETRRRWKVQPTVAAVAELWLRTEAVLEGCSAAEGSAERLSRWAESFGVERGTLEGLFTSVMVNTDCAVVRAP